ncbi:MAG TPA: hypothetical protein VGE39_02475 [Prosthecobacter sp.]
MGLNIIIGKPPPGVNGDSIVRIGNPLFEEVESNFDVMRETLWVTHINHPALAQGSLRSIQSGVPGALFQAISKRVVGYKAGRPVVELMSKGWLATKEDTWQYRRNVGGDASNGLVDGFAYAIRTRFTLTRPTGSGTIKVAPVGNLWGFSTSVWNPTYGESWPYFPTGDATGWLRASLEVTELPPQTGICRVVDTFAYDLPNAA